MKTANAISIVLVLGLGSVLAGCLSDGLPSAEDYRLANDVYVFDGQYHWAKPVLTDSSGAVLDGLGAFEGAGFPRVVQQMLPGFGAEPTVGITSDGAAFVIVHETVYKSTDHGLTWTPVWQFTTPNYPVSVDRFSTADPMLWVDQDTDRVFVSHMHPPLICNYLAYSADGGQTWTDDDNIPVAPGVNSCGTPMIDHQKLMTAPLGPDSSKAPPAPLRDYDNVLYLCVNKINLVTQTVLGTYCAVSFDSGRTFAYDNLAIPPTPGCSGINGHPAAHPDGTVFVPAGHLGSACNRPPIVAVSEDNGLSWTVRRYDGDFRVRSIDPDITFTADGTGYMVVRGADQLTYLFRSRDKFVTWEGPFRISLPGQTLNAFQAITSGDNGRIALAYLGTDTNQSTPEIPNKGVTPSNATGNTVWNAYVAVSYDADSENPTFLTQQVNPREDPVQIGCIWLQGGASNCRNLLDFIDIASGPDGRFMAVITDGCTPRQGCPGDLESSAYQSRDRQVAALVLDAGFGLVADAGTLPSLGLRHPELEPRQPAGNATQGS